jgi:uncharacterized protein (DUF1778 family)
MKKSGRRPIDGESKEAQLHIRMSYAEKQALETAAVILGKPAGTWARELILSAAESVISKGKKSK